MSEDYDLIQRLATYDVAVLEEKGRTYGDSWRKRGGVGAFMMLSRKWDRIENIALGAGYDIFSVCKDNKGDILDDIQDLRRYLLLVEAHVAGEVVEAAAPSARVPVPVCPECRKDVLSECDVVYRRGECPIHSEEVPQKWTLRQGADPENPKAGDWVKEEEEDCGPGPGYVNQDGPVLPWRVPEEQPVAGPFDVIQVLWNDGTYSAMLPNEFGKGADWSEVKLCRVIRDGTNPDDFPLPGPIRPWGGSPTSVDNVGSHTHTIPVQVTPHGPYVASSAVLAGVASAVSGINAAVSAMPKV